MLNKTLPVFEGDCTFNSVRVSFPASGNLSTAQIGDSECIHWSYTGQPVCEVLHAVD